MHVIEKFGFRDLSIAYNIPSEMSHFYLDAIADIAVNDKTGNDKFLFTGNFMRRTWELYFKNIGIRPSESRVFVDDTDFGEVSYLVYGRLNLYLITIDEFNHPNIWEDGDAPSKNELFIRERE